MTRAGRRRVIPRTRTPPPHLILRDSSTIARRSTPRHRQPPVTDSHTRTARSIRRRCIRRQRHRVRTRAAVPRSTVRRHRHRVTGAARQVADDVAELRTAQPTLARLAPRPAHRVPRHRRPVRLRSPPRHINTVVTARQRHAWSIGPAGGRPPRRRRPVAPTRTVARTHLHLVPGPVAQTANRVTRATHRLAVPRTRTPAPPHLITTHSSTIARRLRPRHRQLPITSSHTRSPRSIRHRYIRLHSCRVRTRAAGSRGAQSLYRHQVRARRQIIDRHLELRYRHLPLTSRRTLPFDQVARHR